MHSRRAGFVLSLCSMLLAGCTSAGTEEPPAPGPVDPGSPAPLDDPPSIVSATPPLTATPGQQLTFEVEFLPSTSGPVSIEWFSYRGMAGAITSSSSSSRFTWTAPVCVVTSDPPIISVALSSGSSPWRQQRFEVRGLPGCSVVEEWMPTRNPSAFVGNSSHTATPLPEGRVLVVGGFAAFAGCFSEAEVYEPASDTWRRTGSLGTSRADHTATPLSDGRVLVTGGGCSPEGPARPEYPVIAEVYDPASGTWRSSGSMHFSHANHTATLLADGRVLVTGGWAPLGTHGFAELYAPASGTWSQTRPLSQSRAYHTATLLADGRVLVVGGQNGSREALLSAELYDPASGLWSPTGSLGRPRASHTATLLADGRVLVVGGDGSRNGGTTAEVYEPASGTWSPASSLAVSRRSHAATLLPDGRVLVAGGAETGEVYEPTRGTWSPTRPGWRVRYRPTATLLPDGSVLVVGESRSLYERAERYLGPRP